MLFWNVACSAYLDCGSPERARCHFWLNLVPVFIQPSSFELAPPTLHLKIRKGGFRPLRVLQLMLLSALPLLCCGQRKGAEPMGASSPLPCTAQYWARRICVQPTRVSSTCGHTRTFWSPSARLECCTFSVPCLWLV